MIDTRSLSLMIRLRWVVFRFAYIFPNLVAPKKGSGFQTEQLTPRHSIHLLPHRGRL